MSRGHRTMRLLLERAIMVRSSAFTCDEEYIRDVGLAVAVVCGQPCYNLTEVFNGARS